MYTKARFFLCGKRECGGTFLGKKCSLLSVHFSTFWRGKRRRTKTDASSERRGEKVNDTCSSRKKERKKDSPSLSRARAPRGGNGGGGLNDDTAASTSKLCADDSSFPHSLIIFFSLFSLFFSLFFLSSSFLSTLICYPKRSSLKLLPSSTLLLRLTKTL